VSFTNADAKLITCEGGEIHTGHNCTFYIPPGIIGDPQAANDAMEDAGEILTDLYNYIESLEVNNRKDTPTTADEWLHEECKKIKETVKEAIKKLNNAKNYLTDELYTKAYKRIGSILEQLKEVREETKDATSKGKIIPKATEEILGLIAEAELKLVNIETEKVEKAEIAEEISEIVEEAETVEEPEELVEIAEELLEITETAETAEEAETEEELLGLVEEISEIVEEAAEEPVELAEEAEIIEKSKIAENLTKLEAKIAEELAELAEELAKLEAELAEFKAELARHDVTDTQIEEFIDKAKEKLLAVQEALGLDIIASSYYTTFEYESETYVFLEFEFVPSGTEFSPAAMLIIPFNIICESDLMVLYKSQQDEPVYLIDLEYEIDYENEVITFYIPGFSYYYFTRR